MDDIQWVKHDRLVHSEGTKCATYWAEIGYINLQCKPIYTPYPQKIRAVGWKCFIYFGGKCIDETKRRRSVELSKKDVEKLAIKYLFDYGFRTVNALKKAGLLEEVLSEVGIDL